MKQISPICKKSFKLISDLMISLKKLFVNEFDIHFLIKMAKKAIRCSEFSFNNDTNN